MSQSSPQSGGPSRTAPADLDALLESLQGDARPSVTATTTPATTPERQSGDVTARRVQALIRAFDVLHRQVGSIASQGAVISKVAEAQARDSKTITDLQRNMRYLRAILIQQLQQNSPSNHANLPPLQVKLVVGHLVEQYQQAERDVAVLNSWAMFFVGIALGMTVAAAISFANQLYVLLAIFATSAVMTIAVTGIFGGLARGARSRAAAARRSMDESTLIRTISPNPTPEQAESPQ
jgi:hypothetical protein